MEITQTKSQNSENNKLYCLCQRAKAAGVGQNGKLVLDYWQFRNKFGHLQAQKSKLSFII